MPAQKKFKLGNLKKYAAIVVAAVALNTVPAKIQAQDNKPNTENFDFKKASERDKALYGAITKVLGMKYSEEDAAAKAGQIMSKKAEFNQEQANNYIRFMVENFMGDEYREIMEQAKKNVDGNTEAQDNGKTGKKPAAQNETVTQNKFGKEKKTVVANDSTVTTTIEEEKVFRMADLTPAERTEYNKMLNKIKAAYELRGKVSKNLINMQATHNAQVAFMSSSKEKLFEMAVRGIKFRDIDEKSFVAFNPKTGEGKIVAPQNEMSRIQKQVKKAGGIENFVMEVQKKKSNAAPAKNTGKIPLISLDGNIH